MVMIYTEKILASKLSLLWAHFVGKLAFPYRWLPMSFKVQIHYFYLTFPILAHEFPTIFAMNDRIFYTDCVKTICLVHVLQLQKGEGRVRSSAHCQRVFDSDGSQTPTIRILEMYTTLGPANLCCYCTESIWKTVIFQWPNWFQTAQHAKKYLLSFTPPPFVFNQDTE